MDLDERAMINGILEGDEHAFEGFYKATQARLKRVALGFLGDDTLVDDVVQETYARALPKLREFRFESSVTTWLTRFTINLCLQALAQRKKMLSTETINMEALMQKGSPRMTVEMRRVLHNEIACLDKQTRDLLFAKDIEGRSFLEVAAHFKLPPGTVMSRLARARAKIKTALQSRGTLLKEML
jgi:RNA polymerase sigma-70 factor (ECF subfamily)